MSDVYVSHISKQVRKTRGVLGDAPPRNFKKIDALRLLLGSFLDESRAVVATISSSCPTCIC